MSIVLRQIEDYVLPRMISAITGQVLCLNGCVCVPTRMCTCVQVWLYYVPSMLLFIIQLTVPFGDAVLATHDTVVGFEICEELYCPIKWVVVVTSASNHQSGSLWLSTPNYPPWPAACLSTAWVGVVQWYALPQYILCQLSRPDVCNRQYSLLP